MSIRTIDSIKPLNYKLVYDRANGMPNLLESVVVCVSHPYIAYYMMALLLGGIAYHKFCRQSSVSLYVTLQQYTWGEEVSKS